jgi:hypothetical protein
MLLVLPSRMPLSKSSDFAMTSDPPLLPAITVTCSTKICMVVEMRVLIMLRVLTMVKTCYSQLGWIQMLKHPKDPIFIFD